MATVLLGFGSGAKWGAALGGVTLLVVLIVGAFIHVGGMYVMQVKEQHKTGTMARLLWRRAWMYVLALAGLFACVAIG